jgi:inhibitor of cysteine peptidase
MKFMLTVLLAGIVAGGCAGTGVRVGAAETNAVAAASVPAPVWDGDVLVYRTETWELRVRYLQKGTRSEGMEGSLLHDGMEVPGGRVMGEVMETSMGRMVWRGTHREHPWGKTGWLFEKPGLLLPSSQVRVAPDPPAPAGAAVRMVMSGEGKTEEVSVSPGASIEISLPYTAGTGYSWEALPEKAAESPVTSVARENVSSAPGLPGGPGRTVFLMKAADRGAGELHFVYRRPWEKDTAPASEFKIKVKVE